MHRGKSIRSNRRYFMKMTAAAGAAVAANSLYQSLGTHAAVAESNDRPPNVIYVFSDTHRWQSMSFTDTPGLVMPNMERLALDGLSVNQTISNFPLCSPYRAMLMTGRWPYHQKMLDGSPGMINNGYYLSPNQETLGKPFRRAGYRTAYIGKWHLGGMSAVQFGFDHSIIWAGTHNHWNSNFLSSEDGKNVTYLDYNATGMTDQALSFIKGNQSDPFLLVLSIDPPHDSFTDAPPHWQEIYRHKDFISLRPNVNLAGAPEDFFDQYRGFHAHISAVDHELGRIMRRLDELDLADDTILIYTSDHGFMFQSQGMWGKRLPYEESIRVPFLIRWPGHILSGRVSNALFGTIDHMPTLLGLAGLSIPEACPGTNFTPHMLGHEMKTPTSQFIMGMPCLDYSFRGIRTDRYTLAMMPPARAGSHLLYDNQNDPYQMQNRYEDPAYAGVREQLTEELARYLKKADDPFPLLTTRGFLPSVMAGE